MINLTTKQKKVILGLIVIVILVGGYFLFFKHKANHTDSQIKISIPVNTQNILSQDVALEFEYPARLKSLQSVNIYARVEGILLSQNFKEGDIVNKDDILFKIDPTRYAAKVAMIQAQYDSAKANFAKAKKDWIRVEKLYKQGVLTVDQYDTSLYNYQSGQASLDNLKAQLDDALIDLGYTDVEASTTGRVGMRRYDIGNLVGKGSDSILTTITQLSPIYAEFSIPSNDFYYMRNLSKENIAVELLLSNGKVYETIGKMDFIDSVLDSQTSSVKARALFDNDAYKLLPNDFVRVNLKGFKAQDCIIIPQDTILQDSQGSYVYIVKDNKAHIARVNLGKALKNGQVLVVSGLEDKDILITNNLTKLHEGTNVSTKQ